MSKTYREQKELLALVRHAARSKVGTLSGVANVAVHLDGTGPDFMTTDPTIYQQAQDFMVSFTETT